MQPMLAAAVGWKTLAAVTYFPSFIDQPFAYAMLAPTK